MPLLSDDLATEIKKKFEGLGGNVRLAVFSQALADPETEQVKRLVEELAALDPRLSAQSYNFVLDTGKVEELKIDRIPAVAVLGAEKDHGIRFYGMPSGYEFGTLLDAILDVSQGDSGLSEETRTGLREVRKPVHIQVFGTPTCPYCPRAVRLAYRFALESDHVTADGVEVTGFPDLAQRYAVSSVPKTVVGGRFEFVGAGPESMLLEHVRRAVGDDVIV